MKLLHSSEVALWQLYSLLKPRALLARLIQKRLNLYSHRPLILPFAKKLACPFPLSLSLCDSLLYTAFASHFHEIKSPS